MVSAQSQPAKMLAELINEALKGKKVSLKTRFVSEIFKIPREGRSVDTNVLSVEYSGRVEKKPFRIKKNYLFAEDNIRHPLECTLIANNRLQMDYNRLKKAGIKVKEDFFTLENSFGNIPLEAPNKRTALRLQDFIQLCRAGVPVSVGLSLKFPDLILKQDGMEKKGFACVARFTFKTDEGQTIIEKLYGFGSYEETKGYQTEVKGVATKRLERDCERLRRAGMKVSRMRF